MDTLDERVAYLEGRLEDHAGAVGDLRTATTELGLQAARRFDAVDRRFDAIDRRFENVDRRFDSMDRKFDAIDGRFGAVEGRVDALSLKFDHHFMWLVGIQAATLVAVVGALIGSTAR